MEHYTVECVVYNEGGYCFGGWQSAGLFHDRGEAEAFARGLVADHNRFFDLCHSDGDPRVNVYRWTSSRDKERILDLWAGDDPRPLGRGCGAIKRFTRKGN